MSSSKNNWRNPALYKTRLCDFWMVGKECKYGNRCWYSHGPQELRSVPHLEHDPAAKTVALAEVMSLLPPSKDRARAVDHAQQMMNDANNEVFERFTVPFLNSLALQMANKTETASGDEDKKQPSVQDFMPLLMQFAKISGNIKPSVSPQRVQQGQQKFNAPPMRRSKPNYLSLAPGQPLIRPQKAEVKKTDSLSSSSSTLFSSMTNSSGTASTSLSSSFGTHGLFSPIRQHPNSLCDSFFL